MSTVNKGMFQFIWVFLITTVEGTEKKECKNLRGIRPDPCSKEPISCERAPGSLTAIKSTGHSMLTTTSNWFKAAKECHLLND